MAARRAPASAAFKAWFGDSKVVDPRGRPLRVYHGTYRGGFESFGGAGRGEDTGFFFTDDPLVAWTYAHSDEQYPDILTTKTDRRFGIPALYEVYLRIENPLVVDAGGDKWNTISVYRFPNTERDAIRRAAGSSYASRLSTDALAFAARELGHDGLIVQDVVDDEDGVHGLNDEDYTSTIYVVSDPRQIKSANMNSGKYSRETANILKNPRGSPVVLYHGTFKDFVPSILRDGLTPATGWGGANTTGVFLSGSFEGARRWGRYAAASNLDLDGDGESDFSGDAERYERRFPSLPHVQVLRVTIPATKVKHLRADMEQAEEFGFEGKPTDWRGSLKAIGDVMYAGPIPAAWIEVVQVQAATTLSTKKIAEARLALSAYNTVMRAGDWDVSESVHDAARTLVRRGAETTAADIEPLMVWYREALKSNPRRR